MFSQWQSSSTNSNQKIFRLFEQPEIDKMSFKFICGEAVQGNIETDDSWLRNKKCVQCGWKQSFFQSLNQKCTNGKLSKKKLTANI